MAALRGAAALIAYSKGLATELAPHGVRVNTITPGSIQSPGGDSAREQIATAIGVEPAALLASIPVGHIGRADDIAEAVAYLVCDRASFVVGGQSHHRRRRAASHLSARQQPWDRAPAGIVQRASTFTECCARTRLRCQRCHR